MVYLKTIVEDKKIIVFLSKDQFDNIDSEDDDVLEKYFNGNKDKKTLDILNNILK